MQNLICDVSGFVMVLRPLLGYIVNDTRNNYLSVYLWRWQVSTQIGRVLLKRLGTSALTDQSHHSDCQ